MKSFLLCTLFYVCISPLIAGHIVSGTMHYACTSVGNYDIELIIYRDCSGGAANLDDPASIAIYQEDNLYGTLSVPLTSLESVAAQPYEDCEANSMFYCLQKGKYKFTQTLPLSSSAYTFVYQRCCWSAQIANIENPTERGVTIKTDITPEAQQVCNTQNSVDFPLSFATCPGAEVTYNFPVMDAEGDSLVYDLCTPLEGPGPYFPLPYGAGFSEEMPFPTVDGISFDPETGELTFTPSIVGRYVFGLCVTEYRDGQVLGFYEQPVELFAALDQPVSNSSDIATEEWSLSQFYSSQQLRLTNTHTVAKVKVSLMDGQGKMLQQNTWTNVQQIDLSVQGVARGIYFLNIEQGNQQQTLKIIL